MQRNFHSCSLVTLIFMTAALVAHNTAQAASCVPPPTNIVSWWRFETNLLDGWDSNHALPVSTAPTYVSGRVGFVISNSVVSVADAPSLRFTTNFTITAWINPATTNLFLYYRRQGSVPAQFAPRNANEFLFWSY